MTFAKPYFTIQLSATGFEYDLRVNDVPLDKGAGSVEVELPLNQWVFSGTNHLSARLFGPEFSEGASLRAEVFTRQSGTPESTREALAKFSLNLVNGVPCLSDVDEENITTEAKLIQENKNEWKAELTFELETPFKRWLWLDGASIDMDEATHRSLLVAYHDFWRRLNAKDMEGVATAMHDAALENLEAYYLTSLKESLADLEIEDLITDPTVQLAPFEDLELQLEIFGNKRLARLVEKGGESPIKFLQQGMTIHVDMMFCRTSSGHWVQIR